MILIFIGIFTLLIGLTIAWYFEFFFSKKETPLMTVVNTDIEHKKDNDAAFSPRVGDGVLILFGSQTLTAEIYARTLHKECSQKGIPSRVEDVETYSRRNLCNERCVIMLVSTYGEGEPPDPMMDFYAWIMDEVRGGDELQGVKFAVFGLGDSGYKYFCNMGIIMNRRFEELSAKRIYINGKGDNSKNMEEQFDIWRDGLWETMGSALGISIKADGDRPYECELKLKWFPGSEDALREPFPKKESILDPTQKLPAYGKIICNEELLNGECVMEGKCTRKIIFDISGTTLTYQAGDHLGILPCNNEETVSKYLSILNITEEQADTVISLQNKMFKNVFPARVPVRVVFKWYIDLIGVPKKSSLRAFAHYCTDPEEKDEMLSFLKINHEAQTKYHCLAHQLRTIYGFLSHFKSCKVPLNVFLEVMPRIAPRYFSISSDQLVDFNNVAITVALVPDGLCTTRLCAAPVGTLFVMFCRKSTFHLPLKAKARPIIMIGPGTGIAPFVGFLHRRAFWKRKGHELGPAMLYFGCRHKSQDFLYQKFLQQCLEDGVITDLRVAFSRDQSQKVYVQDLITEDAGKVWRLINSGANIYTCGDGRFMAKAVEATLNNVLQLQGGKGIKEAKEILDGMEKEERFLKDVWSSTVGGN